MGAMKELLVGQDEERSINPLDCTTEPASTVAEAVRVTCAVLGIDHDLAECVVAGVTARMRTAASDIEAVIREIDPGVSINTTRYIFQIARLGTNMRWRRSKAQAEEIATAIVAHSPGAKATVDEQHPSDTCSYLVVKMEGDNRQDFTIYFTPDEEAANNDRQ